MDSTTSPSGSAYDQLSRISKNEVSPQEAQQVLILAFEAKDYLACIEDLMEQNINPQEYIDGLDRIIDTLPPGSEIYHRSLRALRKVCGIYGLLPSSHRVSENLTLITGRFSRPFASGGGSDVWKARDNAGRFFAIKHLRTYEVDKLTHIKKRYCKEVIICRRLTGHINILGIEGVAGLFELCMVSRWMEHGNMPQYVKAHQGVDRLHLLIGIARGLQHLHLNQVIHGDLKGPNILIDPQGNPLLVDYGLSSITMNSTSVNASTPHGGGTYRWLAPELLAGVAGERERQAPTAKSDIYALSMVVVELFSGKDPFPDWTDPTVILRVLAGERPRKPASVEVFGLNPGVWELAKRCWRTKAANRPDVDEVLDHLEGRNVAPSPSFFRWLKHIFNR